MWGSEMRTDGGRRDVAGWGRRDEDGWGIEMRTNEGRRYEDRQWQEGC